MKRRKITPCQKDLCVIIECPLYNYSAEKVKFLKQNEACCPLHHRRRRRRHYHHHRRHHRHYYQRRRRNPLMDPPSHGWTFVSLNFALVSLFLARY